MLTLRQVDNVVQENLYTLKGCKFNRQEQGGTILYTNVQMEKENNIILLGTFRVWEKGNGSCGCGWLPLSDATPECERLRHLFHMEMVMPILVQAHNAATPRAKPVPEQSDNVQQDQKTNYRIAPNKEEDHRKWVAVWKKIKGWADQGQTISEICAGLETAKKSKSYNGQVYGKDTIAKIIRAGKAGELETS